MRRIIFIAITLAATVSGCNRFPDLSIQVTANLDPGSDCSTTPDQTEVLAGGLYDLAAPPFDYVINPRIESYIFNNATEIQAAPGNIRITGFQITIKLPDGTILDFGDALPNPYNVTSSEVIPATDTINGVSLGSAFALAIPVAYTDAIVSAVVAAGFDSIVIDIRANGTTMGGFSQQSAPFSWPISFCVGCLGTTCDPPAEVGDGAPDSCFPGQDGYQWCDSITEEVTTP